ncbi:single-stranded DNA exonuclease RecJ [Thermoplasma sp. Kam2015]|uniref:single-stranded-DNA-specific exonuclease RecJ n=1 Tax=Thermoplasma sp. Kam2015 TaxID=2094122 RepID=UPI000D80D78C|nr:DHH family phosphoesterase [Thermoplasma sp. Kam2015]PYB68752.1 single-stranded DNA exonuclease RecJ [Thermoplasma sp. Kam2015]
MLIEKYLHDEKYRRLFGIARDVASIISEQKRVVIVSHIDADGLSSSAIAKRTLERSGIDTEVVFIKNVDPEILKDLPPGFKWFVDLGSGSMKMIRDAQIECAITDHHLPDQFDIDPEFRRDLLEFLEHSDFGSIYQVNPHMVGLNGSYEVSGSGVTFLVSMAMSDENADLVVPAIVGAVGDVQDANSGILEGLNRIFINLGGDLGLVRIDQDLRFFGRATRPLSKFLELGYDRLPGISNLRGSGSRLLKYLNIPIKDGERFRVYNDLSEDEKRMIRTEIFKRLIIGDIDAFDEVFGETYVFPREDPRSPTYDAKEFATLLNSCGRYGEGMIGLNVAAGDRGEDYMRSISLMSSHRRNLVNGYNHIMAEGLRSLKNIDYFYAGKDINENIVGIIANMIIARNPETRRPLITMADSDPGTVKASVRANKVFLKTGVDLAELFRRAAMGVGGVGGGHDLAAGANIPADRIDDFLRFVDAEIGRAVSSIVESGR